jgi:hypothetical protein
MTQPRPTKTEDAGKRSVKRVKESHRAAFSARWDNVNHWNGDANYKGILTYVSFHDTVNYEDRFRILSAIIVVSRQF